jgi:hypothetical protein
MGGKLMKNFARRYLLYGIILISTSFFAVPKGDTYITVVFNGTSSGMNARLWAPLFDLPTICTLLWALELNTFMADFNIGDIFLNFMSEERRVRLVAVNITHYVKKCAGAPEGNTSSPVGKVSNGWNLLP